jgi:L-ascorbate metabolism protein UlaG (beta-lactamase superfamily)
VKLWHAGDSGLCDAFREIGERCGPIDFGMIPIGAYQPRRIMRPMHMNPGEAVAAFLQSQCRRAVAMHWGTFRFTDEPLGEPPLLLDLALREASLPADVFTSGKVGEVWEIQPPAWA